MFVATPAVPSLVAPPAAATASADSRCPLTCTLILATPDEPTRVGSPCNLIFRAFNPTSEEINLQIDLDYRNRNGRPNAYACTAQRKETGAFLPIEDRAQFLTGVLSPSRILPGESHTVPLTLSHWATITEPGVYIVTFSRQLQWHEGSNLDPLLLKSGQVSASIELVMAPPDRAAQRALIEKLGKLLMTNSAVAEEAANSLACIHDVATVPHWLQALQSLSAHVRFVAVTSLGNFPDNAQAIRALEGQVTDSVILKTRYSHYEEKVAYDAWQQHRLHAVESIAKAKSPASISFLLTLQKDPNEGIRLTTLQTIVQYPGRYVGDQLQEALQGFANDSSSLVREEAMRLIKGGVLRATSN